jgi:two-component system NtrC family sensor kinase
MSLKRKVYLLVVSVLAVMALVAVMVGRYVVLPSFDALEREEAKDQIGRCVKALDEEAHHLHLTCQDWAYWDDTYQFIKDRNAEYIAANLQSDMLETLSVDLLYICDLQGRHVWTSTRHPPNGAPAELPDFPDRGLPRTHPFLAIRTGDGLCGIWSTAWGPMLVAAVPITTSDEKAPPRGILVMGRFVSDAFVVSMAERLDGKLTARSVRDKRWSPEQQAIARRLAGQGGQVLSEAKGDSLDIYEVVPDLEKHPALLAEATIPRDITARGHAATRSLAVSLLIVALFAAPLLMALVNRAVIRPIAALTNHAVQVAQSGDLSARLNTDRRDEIGVLSRQFDVMLEKLAETRARLLSRSYKSGMEQMAAGALHNVRNALAPAVVRLGEAQEHLRAAQPSRLAMAVRELARACAEGRRNPDLESYVGLAGVRLFETLGAVEDDLIAASQQIGRIERMLPDPDAFGRVEPMTEEFTLDTGRRGGTEPGRGRAGPRGPGHGRPGPRQSADQCRRGPR